MGHEQNTDPEDNSRDELQRKRNAPCSFALSYARPTDEVGTIINPEGNHDTECDGELLKGDKTSSDLGRCKLGTVSGKIMIK